MPVETSETKQIAVRLPKEQYDGIEQIATDGRYKVSKSEVVRTAVEEHLNNQE